NISAAIPIAPIFQQVKIVFTNSIVPNIIYIITAKNFSDCSGNIQTTTQSLQFALPDSIKHGDIIINEILYNPKSFGFDYLEIYNASNKTLDLKDLKIANTDQYGDLATIVQASTNSTIIFPKSYALITEDTAWVKANYFTSNPKVFNEISNLPSFNDDEGTVVLLNDNLDQIDSLHYFSSWQFKLLEVKDGVSLERISFDAATQDSSNWHSAAAVVGFGTPGLINSQVYEESTSTDEISLDNKIFSPDQDGFKDFLVINYLFDKPGYVISIKIFDEHGTIIRDLIRNSTVLQKGIITWDGLTDKSARASVGAYIVYAEIFDLNGKVKHFKETCILAGKK
ncbi:MAG: lamin tail domain-containing protein, partial [Ignavibacteria bacterium]|nr:lamin tail domain-containing protein [Ignavibacteria bacterium]